MANDLTVTPRYRRTIEDLQERMHQSADGVEYWMAREIHPILGYPTWREFDAVIVRACRALTGNDVDPSHHIVLTHKMVEVGSDAKRRQDDYFLSRAACSLIVLNGDPSKPEIAAGQAYFVVQTRRMEMEDQRVEDEKRLELREKVAQSHRMVSGVAQNAGVSSRMQGIFHDARYQGLYGMRLSDVKRRKGLGEKERIYDRAGPMELSANDFQMNLAAEVIQKEGVQGEAETIDRNKAVAADVRRVMTEQGATPPEDLPLAEPIKEVKNGIERAKNSYGSLTTLPTSRSSFPSNLGTALWRHLL